MSQLAITQAQYDRPSLPDQLRAELVQTTGGLARLEESLERYAKHRSWTLGVVLANLMLLMLHALSPTRTAGDERFWARG